MWLYTEPVTTVSSQFSNYKTLSGASQIFNNGYCVSPEGLKGNEKKNKNNQAGLACFPIFFLRNTHDASLYHIVLRFVSAWEIDIKYGVYFERERAYPIFLIFKNFSKYFRLITVAYKWHKTVRSIYYREFNISTVVCYSSLSMSYLYSKVY